MARLFVVLIALCSLLALTSDAEARTNRYYPIVHQVRPGHTLLGIAKRWNVSLEALCHANEITPKKPIRPDQKLIVPAREDKDGKRARKLVDAGFLKSKADQRRLLKELEEEAKAKLEAKIHASRKRHKRKAEPLPKKQASSKPKATKKTRPSPARSKRAKLSDRRKGKARPAKSRTKKRGKTRGKGYARRPKKWNHVRIRGLMGTWQGVAVDARNGKVMPEARSGFRKVMRSWRTGKSTKIHPRLIYLLTKVSNHFGGREIYIVSGYRPTSVSSHSRHNHGHAVDFKIQGVPNHVLRDYLRTLPSVGVGYYPNSTHVHLDTRPSSSYWVDYSGPGEKPRYSYQGYTDRYGPPGGRKGKRKASRKRSHQHWGRRGAGSKSSGAK